MDYPYSKSYKYIEGLGLVSGLLTNVRDKLKEATDRITAHCFLFLVLLDASEKKSQITET